ncbi:hypothetical protein BGX26_007926 [Mortierella sp. AD094]|nr:hypothetical protein BGX26_007926 [Mortierella sp. AD094]
MKMMMTQAEIVQYGRLRAEMPRAPGPSTGAQPKRTGFGSEVNSGLAARPKVPSKLGVYVMNMPNVTTTTMTTTRSFSARSSEMPIDGPEGLVLKSKSMAWTQSLSSLVGFSNSFTQKRTRASLSEPSLYPARRLEELELGGRATEVDEKLSTGNGADMRRAARRRMQESEDDGDIEMESGDQYDDDDDDDSSQSYWSLLRRKNNRNRRRATSTTAATPRSVDNKHIHPSFSSAVSLTSSNHAHSHGIVISSKSPNKTKHARRRTGTSSLSSPSVSLSPMQVSGRISTSLSSNSEASSTVCFTESYGFSGMLMLSLFLFFLFLLEGTNQFYNIQSALQSIIL